MKKVELYIIIKIGIQEIPVEYKFFITILKFS